MVLFLIFVRFFFDVFTLYHSINCLSIKLICVYNIFSSSLDSGGDILLVLLLLLFAKEWSSLSDSEEDDEDDEECCESCISSSEDGFVAMYILYTVWLLESTDLFDVLKDTRRVCYFKKYNRICIIMFYNIILFTF